MGRRDPPLPAAVESLRLNLEREAAARSALAADVTAQVKELHGMLAQANERREKDAADAAAAADQRASEREARLASLEGAGLGSLRAELDAVREQLRKSSRECLRRCEAGMPPRGL
ncbi:unnamed protein product [Prorocentrum cordatum]|uniref:Uncharacterized protein n=1 Tax=Prorocentrum cordatum TaxID=2364126 RepID=A0ABN9SFR6_9DINO|nr:unnamed protein product [Polarella glacialis]